MSSPSAYRGFKRQVNTYYVHDKQAKEIRFGIPTMSLPSKGNSKPRFMGSARVCSKGWGHPTYGNSLGDTENPDTMTREQIVGTELRWCRYRVHQMPDLAMPEDKALPLIEDLGVYGVIVDFYEDPELIIVELSEHFVSQAPRQ